MERINFHSLIGEVIEELSYMEEAKNITIHAEIDPGKDFYYDQSRGTAKSAFQWDQLS